jgi:hypothetical protein
VKKVEEKSFAFERLLQSKKLEKVQMQNFFKATQNLRLPLINSSNFVQNSSSVKNT